jgi:hypothetical protein
MSKAVVTTAIIITSSLLLGGCLPKTQAPQSVTDQVSESQKFAEAIKSGQPTLCTITKDGDKIEYLIKGKMFKMNAITTVKDEETGKETQSQSFMISDSVYMYTWGSDQSQGIKMRIPTDLPAEASAKEGEAKKYQSSAPDFEDESSYESFAEDGYTINCQETNVLDSDFLVPQGINFIDPTEMMQAVTPQDGSGQIDIQKLQEMAKQYE